MAMKKVFMITLSDISDSPTEEIILFTTYKKAFNFVKNTTGLTDNELNNIEKFGFTNYAYRKLVSIQEYEVL